MSFSVGTAGQVKLFLFFLAVGAVTGLVFGAGFTAKKKVRKFVLDFLTVILSVATYLATSYFYCGGLLYFYTAFAFFSGEGVLVTIYFRVVPKFKRVRTRP